jgi:hypothetical protein
MSESFNNILDQCLEAVENGELSVQQCIERYPQFARELSSLLQISKKLNQAPAISPRPAFRQHAHTRMQNLVLANPPRIELKTKQVPLQKKVSRNRRPLARLITTLAIVIALLFSGTGIAYASTDALPGDVIYPVKTAVEDIQLVFADDEKDVELLNDFANQRVAEIQALIQEGRYEDISTAAQAYQKTNEKLGKALGKLPDDQKREVIAAVVSAAHQNRTETLTGLLDKVPEQGQKGIQNALEAGPPDHAGGPPEDKGKPDCPPGKPDDVGKPDTPGQKTKEPKETGPPESDCDTE